MKVYLRISLEDTSLLQSRLCYIALGRSAHIYYPGIKAWFIVRPCVKEIGDWEGGLGYLFRKVGMWEWFKECGRARCVLEIIEDILGFRALHLARFLLSHGIKMKFLEKIQGMDNQPGFKPQASARISYEETNSG